ncbi:S8 family serine peptidase [Paenibacillus bovis]|uniref:Peptidase n=1 Tax=Paenibacillus bovis TaxID=1616788 RepID=A0A172ZEF9_9BACL|nr:S8 family serine peptidase [Paenibacillus bovis]ANF96018.1 peptidase [Paenibacillus bovis]
MYLKKLHVLRKLSYCSLAVLITAGLAASPAAAYAASGNLTSPYVLEQQSLPDKLLSLTTGETNVISPDINTNSSQRTNVIVQLTTQPAAVGEYASTIGLESVAAESTESTVNSQQTSIINQALAKGIQLKVNYRYNTVLNGLEISIPANQIPVLAQLPGIKSIYDNSAVYHIPVEETPQSVGQATYDPSALSLIGAQTAWAKGLTGKGVKVGVIDTGLDYMHPDLKKVYKGGYDSVDKDRDPYETPPISIAQDTYKLGYPGSLHGTHAAGIIAGRAENKTSEVVQKGVAYDVDLYAYRVASRNPATNKESVNSATLIDGIEHAVKDGMDIINLSLGISTNKDVNSPISTAVNNAVLSGATVVVANGNDADSGPYYYSVNSPATSQLAISVGASSIPYHLYQATVTASVYGDQAARISNADKGTTVQNNVYATASAGQNYALNVMAWQLNRENFAEMIGTGKVQGIYAGLGAESDYQNKDVAGKIVLVSRGNLQFDDKIKIAAKHGARAIIIFNGNAQNAHPDEADLSASIGGRDGYLGSTAYIGEGFEYIPAFDMNGVEGRALARAALAHPEQPIQFRFGADYPKTEIDGDRMASFSSRGPNQDGLLGIKPDMAAPGVNIRSTVPAYGKYIQDASYSQAYKRESGTSMAAPMVAGMAALLKQEHPDWTPFDIRAALANTSDRLTDESGKVYDVYSQGAGRANVSAAVYTPAVLQTVEPVTILDKNWKRQTITNYNPSAAFGTVPAGGSEQLKKLQLKNTSGTAVTYQASVNMHSSVTSDPARPTATPDTSQIQARLQGLGAGNTITAGAHAASEFTLALQPTAAAVDGVYEGEVVLTAAGYPALHLPFVIHVGQNAPDIGQGIQDISISNTVIRMNGQENSADIGFRLTSTDANVLELNAYGLDGKYAGTLVQQVREPVNGAYPIHPPGNYTFKHIDNIAMVLTASGQTAFQALPKGVYQLEIAAYNIDETGNVKRSSTKRANLSYRIAGTEADRVADAVRPFNKIQTGNRTIGQPVLTFPQDERLVYKIISSSGDKYVNDAGVLIKYPAGSYSIVRLQIQISSAADPSVSQTVNALVKVEGTKAKTK